MSLLFLFHSNKRSAQGDRLSAITMALQYGSESDEDAALAGRNWNALSLIPLIKTFTMSKSVELLINSDTFISEIFCTHCVIPLNLAAGEMG